MAQDRLAEGLRTKGFDRLSPNGDRVIDDRLNKPEALSAF
jgi:hypothetical protein